MRIVIIGANARSLVANRGRLIDAWRTMGHDVVAFVPAYDADPAWLARLTIPFQLVPLRRLSLNPVSDLSALLRMYRLLRRHRADVVFSYSIKAIVYGSLAARLAGARAQYALITGLGYLFSGTTPKQRVFRSVAVALYRFALRFNRRVIFQNPDDLALFQALGVLRGPRHGVVVNGSGVDVAEFAFVPPPPGPVTFLLMARLTRDKGIYQFVAAAGRLHARHPAARFLVLGEHDPNLPNAIPAADIDRWKAEGTVTFGGYHRDVRSFLAAASVYVLPSTYREGTPRSILEAMATGRAIITTDTPGCRETVAEGVNGFLIPAGDVAALERAMERMLDDPALIAPMGRASRRIAEEKYDVHHVNAAMLQAMDLAGA